jgi:adenosylcobinamide-GDP ribazoletransferase
MLSTFVRHYALAIQFFTRIPVTGALAAWVGYSPEMLRRSAGHLPGVGCLVGLLAALLHGLLLEGLPEGGYSPLVAAVLSTALTVMLTGGFHEDGLADVADGLGGSQDRVRALQIMKDSRIGAFGAMALMLGLMAKVSLLAVLGAADTLLVCVSIWVAHTGSRLFPLLVIWGLPHVGDADGSKSKPLADQISSATLATGAAWTLAVLLLSTLWLDGAAVVFSMALPLLAFWGMRQWLNHRLAGFTGDGLGATQQVCEIACYLGFALALGPVMGAWLGLTAASAG